MKEDVNFPTETDIEVITISKQNEHPTLSEIEAGILAKHDLEVLLPKCKKGSLEPLKTSQRRISHHTHAPIA